MALLEMNAQITQNSSAYPSEVLPEPWNESYESETVSPCLRIPEIKVAGKTDTSAGARRRKQRGGSNDVKKLPSLPLAKLIALAACVSALAALFLVVLPDFQPEIVSFPARFETFTLRYTMPVCFFQLGFFFILYRIRKR